MPSDFDCSNTVDLDVCGDARSMSIAVPGGSGQVVLTENRRERVYSGFKSQRTTFCDARPGLCLIIRIF